MNTFRITHWIICGLIVTLSTVIGIKFYFSYKKKIFINRKPPKYWKCIGTLEEITIYPIKSCAGIDLDFVKCDTLGLIYNGILDRRFALLEADTSKILSARTCPKMLKIQPEIQDNLLTVTAPGMDDLEIDLTRISTICNKNTEETYLWGSRVLVTKCGQEYDKWFSKYLFNLNKGAILVYYNFEVPTKDVISMLKDENFLGSDTGALHDASSYMVINQTSIQDLNDRLPTNDKVHHKQFRPNFLIKTNSPPYVEDNWDWVKIGNETIFRCIAPSYRCVLTTINHETCERHQNNEPLRTLRDYRIWGKQKHPRMGILLGLRNYGVIKKGDVVFVEE